MIRHLLHALVLFFADRFSSCLVFILQPAPSRSRRTNTKERGDDRHAQIVAELSLRRPKGSGELDGGHRLQIFWRELYASRCERECQGQFFLLVKCENKVWPALPLEHAVR